VSIISSQNFSGTRLKVDGTLFEKCHFDNCTLVYSGGELPQFRGCTMTQIQFALDGPAARTAAYIRTTFQAGAGAVVRDWLPELFRSASQPQQQHPQQPRS
jgi:hypothetical protein